MRRYTITVNDSTRVIDVEAVTANSFRVQLDGRLIDVSLDDHRDLAHSAVTPGVQVRRQSSTGMIAPAVPSQAPAAPAAPSGEGATAASVPRPAAPSAAPPAASPGGGLNKMTAPMPGVILEITAAAGATVSRGDTLMILEAMKMKNGLKAPKDGTIAEIYVSVGQQVKYGETLVRFEEN